jgi:metal-responsive CopG/Arc/MetJ family transcriptional regulator
MTGKSKKATFNLHTEVLDELDQVMAKGIASSKNALVEQALRKELNEIKRLTRKSLWQEAAKDPLFIKDVAQVEYDFTDADSETIGSID